MCMTSVHGTINGSAYANWLAMLCGTSTKTDHGCTSSPIFMRSLRSQLLSSTLRLKNTTREQHECMNLIHSDLNTTEASTYGYFGDASWHLYVDTSDSWTIRSSRCSTTL